MPASRGEVESIVFVVVCYTTIILNEFLKAWVSDGKNTKLVRGKFINRGPLIGDSKFNQAVKKIDALALPSTFPKKNVPGLLK